MIKTEPDSDAIRLGFMRFISFMKRAEQRAYREIFSRGFLCSALAFPR